MKIKTPVVLDTSLWEIIPDFALINPRPFLVITKASQDDWIMDPKFQTYINDIQADGIHDGCYHFFIPTTDPLKQAQKFVSVVRPEITNKTILVLDVEREGTTAAMMKTWFDHVRSNFPSNLVMLYGRKEMLDRISMTTAEKTYFKQIPIWTAGYPTYPDNFTEPPAFYIPDQTKYGPVWLWQYSDSALINGIQGEVDVNWISPSLVTYLDTGSSHGEVLFGGAVSHLWGRHANSDYHLLLCDTKKASRCHVTNTGQKLVRVDDQARKDGASICVNMDGWDMFDPTPLPDNLAVSDGIVYRDWKEFVPFLNITKDKTALIDWDQLGALYNTASGKRLLIEDGIIKPYLYGSGTEYIEVHPRTGIGIHTDGRLMIAVVDGRSSQSAGVTLLELANLLKTNGAVIAYDADGGNSSALWIQDRIVNIPSGGGRAVVNHLELFYSSEVTMRVATAWTIEQTNVRNAASSDGAIVGKIPANTKVTGTQESGNWLYVTSVSVPGWVNKSSLRDLTWTDVVVPPTPPDPPPTTGKTVTVTVDLEGYKTKTFTGTLEPL